MAAPSTPTSSPTISELGAPRKKTKLTKDAPVFTPGPVRGDCRFPPDEYQDIELAAYHQQFEVTPFGEIADYPRHIPYNSEKKSFLEKTHREHLEGEQRFLVCSSLCQSDEIKSSSTPSRYLVMRPYTLCYGTITLAWSGPHHSSSARVIRKYVHRLSTDRHADQGQTTPAKMLNRNPGLRDICHSITGGALVAQGSKTLRESSIDTDLSQATGFHMRRLKPLHPLSATIYDML